MLEPLRSRAAHVVSLVKEGLWGKIAGLLWSGYGLFSAWRQELVKSEDQAKWGIFKLLPRLSLQGWFIVALIIVLAWMLELSFRSSFRLSKKVDDLEVTLTPKIKVFLEDESVEPLVVPTSAPGTHARYFQFSVSAAGSAAVHDCEAILTEVRRMEGEVLSENFVEEHINCKWSQNQVETTKVDIRDKDKKRVNLFALSNQSPPFVEVQTIPLKFRLPEAVQLPGKYLIKVLVTASDSVSVPRAFIFEWSDFQNAKILEA